MRKLYLVPVILVGLFLLIFVLAGTPFVLNFVSQKIQSIVQTETGVGLIIGSMRGNLFYSLRVEHIQVPGAVEIARLKIAYNPISLFSRKVDITSVSIDGLDVDVDGVTEIVENIPRRTDSTTSAEPSPWRIYIRELLVTNSGILISFVEKPMIASLDLSAAMLPDRFMIDSLRIATERSVVVVKGDVPLHDSADLHLQYEMSLAAEDFGVSELRGKIQSQGEIKGAWARLFLHSVTKLNARYSEHGLTGTIRLDWQIPDLENLDVDARLHAMTPSLMGNIEERDTLQLTLNASGKDFLLEVVSEYGVVQYEGLLGGDLERPQLESEIRGLLKYDGLRSSFTGEINFQNDVLELKSFRIRGDSLDAYASLSMNTVRGEIIDAQIHLSCQDLSMIDHFAHTEQAISGRLSLDASAAGPLINPRAEMKLSLSDVVAYGEGVSNAFFDVSMEDRVILLDSGSVASRRGLIQVEGWYDLTSHDVSAHVHSDQIAFQSPEVFGSDTIQIGGRVALDLMVSGNVQNPKGKGEIVIDDIVYDTVTFGNCRLDISLEDTTLQLSLVNGDKSLVLEGGAFLHGVLPFSAELQLSHFVLGGYLASTDGYVSGVLSAQGDMLHPAKIVGDAAIDTIYMSVEQGILQNVGAINVHLEEGVIQLNSCALAVAGQELSAHGSIPLDFERSALDVSVKSSRVQLSALAAIMPSRPDVRGILDLDLRVQGRSDAPQINGQLLLENVQYTGQDVNVDSVNCVLRFANNNVNIERFTGKVNRGGFDIDGFVKIGEGHLDTMLLDIAVDKIDYRNKDFGKVVFSSDIQVSARNDSFNISGEVIIDTAKYDAPFKLQTVVGMLTRVNRPAPEQPQIMKQIYCDVGISAPNDVEIDNKVADLEVSFDLQLKGYLSRLIVYGSVISVDEGTIAYLSKKFSILHAAVHFDNPYKIDPVIDLTASTSVSAEDGNYEIYMLLEGTVDKWELELSSNPPLPEQDIVSLLLIGQRRPGSVSDAVSGVTLGGKAEAYAADLVRYGIERGAEQYLGLDKVKISGESTDTTEMELNIEKSIGDKFTLIYSMGLESWELLQIGAKYDVTEKLSIFTLYDQANLNTSVDVDYHFKIR
ncbi:translocation/assembly module TamB domain-containing protein [candidate division WOR-3 bacterium]|nr:translocation/assembly module TamB domain-containing protein [candidate division WOR-3 bacterium]